MRREVYRLVAPGVTELDEVVEIIRRGGQVVRERRAPDGSVLESRPAVDQEAMILAEEEHLAAQGAARERLRTMSPAQFNALPQALQDVITVLGYREEETGRP